MQDEVRDESDRGECKNPLGCAAKKKKFMNKEFIRDTYPGPCSQPALTKTLFTTRKSGLLLGAPLVDD